MGGIGAIELIKTFPRQPFTQHLKFLIQLDRRGKDDCVFYDCDNKNFNKMIQSYGFKKADGTFSDISIIAPVWGIAAVNLSVGYYSEHSVAERLFIKEAEATFCKLDRILIDHRKFPVYEYVKNKTFNTINFCSEEPIKHEFPSNECSWCGNAINQYNRHWIKEDDFFMPLCDECFTFYTA